MLANPSKTHPYGAVIVEAQHRIGHPVNFNKGTIGGMAVTPTQAQKDSGAWDAADRRWTKIEEMEKAADAVLDSCIEPLSKEKGCRQYLPKADRTKQDIGQRMKQYADACRHVAMGIYDVRFAETYFDHQCDPKNPDVLQADEQKWLKVAFQKALADLEKYNEIKARTQTPEGLMRHPLELQVKVLEEKLERALTLLEELTAPSGKKS